MAKNLEKKLTFRLKDDDLALLRQIAEKQGLKTAFLVRQVVAGYLKGVRRTNALLTGTEK